MTGAQAVHEYHIQELITLKSEINETITALWEIERYALLATAAIWTWSLTNAPTGLSVAKWLPLGLNLLFGLRSLALHRHIVTISRYLTLLEDTFLPDDSLGWEKYLERHADPLTVASSTILWIALLAASALLPYFFG